MGMEKSKTVPHSRKEPGMYCCNCGKKLGDEDRFCDNCGTPVYESGNEDITRQEEGQKTADEDAEDGSEAEVPDVEITEDSPEPEAENTVVLEKRPEFEAAGGAEKGPDDSSSGVLSDLEKKIMKNMEDELILTMPETVGQGRKPYEENSVQHAQPPYGNGSDSQGQYGGGRVPGDHDMPAEAEKDRQMPYGQASGGKPPKKKKKALIITLACVVAVLAVIVAVLLFLLFSPENKLKKCVADRDWAAAAALYEESFQGSEKKEEKADEIFRDAVDALKEEFIAGTMDYSTVKRHLKAIEDFWDDSYVADALDFVRELGDSREAFEEAEQHMQREEYEEAIRLYGEVVSSDANYEAAKEKLETAKAAYKEKILGEAKAYAEIADYDSAAAAIEKGLEILAGDTELKSRLEELKEEQAEYETKVLLTEAKNYASQNHYFEAMDVIRNGLSEKPNNDKLEAALKDYSEKYKQDILAKAEAAIGTDENYEAAILVFDSALNTLNGEYAEIEQAIREKREEYVQKQLEKSERENAESAIVGVWQGTMVSGEGLEIPMDQFLLMSGMAGSSAMISCRPDGGFHLELLGETGDGTWRRDETGNGVYYLDLGGESQQVQIDNSGRLRMNLNGIELIFEKTGEA